MHMLKKAIRQNSTAIHSIQQFVHHGEAKHIVSAMRGTNVLMYFNVFVRMCMHTYICTLLSRVHNNVKREEHLYITVSGVFKTLVISLMILQRSTCFNTTGTYT